MGTRIFCDQNISFNYGFVFFSNKIFGLIVFHLFLHFFVCKHSMFIPRVRPNLNEYFPFFQIAILINHANKNSTVWNQNLCFLFESNSLTQHHILKDLVKQGLSLESKIFFLFLLFLMKLLFLFNAKHYRSLENTCKLPRRSKEDFHFIHHSFFLLFAEVLLDQTCNSSINLVHHEFNVQSLYGFLQLFHENIITYTLA